MTWRMGRRALASATALVVGLATTQSVAQAQVDLDVPFAKSAVARFAASNGVYVDSLVVQEAAAQLANAEFYLCYGAQPSCQVARAASTREAAVRGYLLDILQNKPRVESIMERVFKASGMQLAAIGWPGGPLFTRFASIGLPSGVGDFSYVHWDGAEAVPATASRAILSTGVHTFALRSGGSTRELRFSIDRAAQGVAVRVLSDRAVAGVPAMLASRVEPQFDRFCLTKDIDVTEPKYRTSIGGGGPPARPSDFHSARLVRVRLEGSPAGCGAACKRWIGSAIVQALASWRAGCTRCPPETLTSVEVDADRYVAVRALDAAQFSADRGAQSGIPDAAFVATSAFAMGSVSPAMGFQRFEKSGDLPALCGGATIPASIGNVANSAISLVCTAPRGACLASEGCKEIPLRIGGSDTCKGPIACGLPDSSVTLNTPAFRFMHGRGDSQAPGGMFLIGADSGLQDGRVIPLFPILLHEVGHWFGLPHVDSDRGTDDRDEVMKDTGGDDKICISRGALNMVYSAVDQSWPYRLTGSGALRYARPR